MKMNNKKEEKNIYRYIYQNDVVFKKNIEVFIENIS